MSESKRKIVLKKLSALNTVWHPESSLVFKSQQERLVIGQYVDKKLVSLDEEMLALCDEWNFKPDESLLEDDNEHSNVSADEHSESEDNSGPNVTETDPEVATEIVCRVSPMEKVVNLVKNTSNNDSKILISNFSHALNDIISNLEGDKGELTDEKDKLVSQLNSLQGEHNELQEKYDALNAKFTAMKNLFS